MYRDLPNLACVHFICSLTVSQVKRDDKTNKNRPRRIVSSPRSHRTIVPSCGALRVRTYLGEDGRVEDIGYNLENGVVGGGAAADQDARPLR